MQFDFRKKNKKTRVVDVCVQGPRPSPLTQLPPRPSFLLFAQGKAAGAVVDAISVAQLVIKKEKEAFEKVEEDNQARFNFSRNKGMQNCNQVRFRRRFPRLPSERAAAAARGLRAAVAAVPPILRAAEAAERSNPWMRISPERLRLL